MTALATSPNLGAIKANGLNSDEHSMRLLSMHEYQQRIELHGELLAKLLRDNPGVTSMDYEQYGRVAAVEVGL